MTVTRFVRQSDGLDIDDEELFTDLTQNNKQLKLVALGPGESYSKLFS